MNHDRRIHQLNHIRGNTRKNIAHQSSSNISYICGNYGSHHRHHHRIGKITLCLDKLLPKEEEEKMTRMPRTEIKMKNFDVHRQAE
eukprot:9189738-Karenia_brevis.AAC.1